MERARDTISYGKISGAVGTFANIDPFIERHALKKLGLKPAPVSTQIVQRDRHAEFFTTLSIIASSIEKFSVEVRHLTKDRGTRGRRAFYKGTEGLVSHAA